MIKLTITGTDVKAEKVVKPGWYATKLQDPRQEVAKDKKSENFVVDCEGMEDDAQGVPCRCYFSEKFIQNINPLVRATGSLQGIPNPLDEEKGLDPAYDFAKTDGNIVLAKWATDRGKSGEDKARNAIVDWAPLPENHPLAAMNPKIGSEAAVPVGGFTQ